MKFMHLTEWFQRILPCTWKIHSSITSFKLLQYWKWYITCWVFTVNLLLIVKKNLCSGRNSGGIRVSNLSARGSILEHICSSRFGEKSREINRPIYTQTITREEGLIRLLILIWCILVLEVWQDLVFWKFYKFSGIFLYTNILIRIDQM